MYSTRPDSRRRGSCPRGAAGSVYDTWPAASVRPGSDEFATIGAVCQMHGLRNRIALQLARTCLRERHRSAVQRGNGRRNIVRLVQDHDIPFEPHACNTHAHAQLSLFLCAPRAQLSHPSIRALVCAGERSTASRQAVQARVQPPSLLGGRRETTHLGQARSLAGPIVRARSETLPQAAKLLNVVHLGLKHAHEQDVSGGRVLS